MKKIVVLLVVMLLFSSVNAFAETNEELLASLKECLVNSFGYSVKEAEGFEIVNKNKLSTNEKIKLLKERCASELENSISNYFYGNLETVSYSYDEIYITDALQSMLSYDAWVISIAHPSHPEWVYKLDNYTDGKYMSSPFIGGAWNITWNDVSPEGMLRRVLREAREQGWFVNWTEEAKQALENSVEMHFDYTEGIDPPMLWTGCSAGNAIHELFAAVSNDPMEIDKELRQWRDAELASYGISAEETALLAPGYFSYEIRGMVDGYGRIPVPITATRFVGEVPEKYKQYLLHPELEGWASLCGGIFECDYYDSPDGYGLIAYEKNGQRMLVKLEYYLEEQITNIIPLSTTALYADYSVYIIPYISHVWNGWTWADSARWVIGYQNSPSEYERFYLDTYQCIRKYLRFDKTTGEKISIVPSARYGNEATISIYRDDLVLLNETVIQNMPSNIRMIDLDEFTDPYLWLNSFERVPEGYVLLRQQKDYPNGTLARIIEYPIEEEWTVQVGDEQFRITEDDFDVRGTDMINKESYVILRDQQNYPDGTRAKIIEFPDREKTQWTVSVGNEYFLSNEYGIALDYSISAYPDVGNQLYNETIGYLKVLNSMELKAERNESSETLMKLPAGTVMFDLSGYENTGEPWIRVAVPQNRDKIGWRMHPSDVVGYISVDVEYDEGTKQHFYEGVLFGNTPLALEWRE